MLATLNNLAMTYRALGRDEEALRLRRDVYFGYVKLHGKENERTLVAANNYADFLICLRRLEEAKALLRKTTPVARRVLGESHDLTLRLRFNYARALFLDTGATLADQREAMAMLEDTERTARRVLGGAHPFTGSIERCLKEARSTLAFDAP